MICDISSPWQSKNLNFKITVKIKANLGLGHNILKYGN